MSCFSPRIDHIHLTGRVLLSTQNGSGYLPCAPDDWSLFCVRQGDAEIHIAAQAVHVHCDDFLLLSPQSCHEIAVNDDGCVLLIQFSGVTALRPEVFCRLSAEDNTAAQSLLVLLETGSLTGQAQDCVLEALLLQLFSPAALLWEEPPVTSLPLRILQYLNVHYREDLALNDLSETFDISASHVIHVFKPLFGLSPIQYLIHRRIGEAQHMLRRTTQRADEIAAQIGIPNRIYFYRTFKRLTGLSPSQYRSAVCGETDQISR